MSSLRALAVAEIELGRLEAAVNAAQGCDVRARETLLEQVIDLAVARRLFGLPDETTEGDNL